MTGFYCRKKSGFRLKLAGLTRKHFWQGRDNRGLARDPCPVFITRLRHILSFYIFLSYQIFVVFLEKPCFLCYGRLNLTNYKNCRFSSELNVLITTGILNKSWTHKLIHFLLPNFSLPVIRVKFSKSLAFPLRVKTKISTDFSRWLRLWKSTISS